MITRRGFLRFIGGSFLSAVSFSAYAVGIEPMLLTHVKRYSLTPPGWPDGLEAARRRACRHPCLPAVDDARADRVACRAGECLAAGPDRSARRLCRRHATGDGLGRCRGVGAGPVRAEGAARRAVHPRQPRLVGGSVGAKSRQRADDRPQGARGGRHSRDGKRRRADREGRPRRVDRRAGGPACAAAGQGMGPQALRRAGRSPGNASAR